MSKALVVMVLVVAAQLLPSCDGGDGSVQSQPQVLGWVAEKRTRITEVDPYIIVVNQIEHGVPYEFWRSVEVGDLVKYQDGKWSIVRRRGR